MRRVGAGVVDFALRRASNIEWHEMKIDKTAGARANKQTPCVLWFTGLSGSGKSTVADRLEQKLHAMGQRTYLLDGDNVPPRPQQGSRLHRPGPGREHPPGGRGGQADDGRRACRPDLLHLAFSLGAADGPGYDGGERVRRSLRRYARWRSASRAIPRAFTRRPGPASSRTSRASIPTTRCRKTRKSSLPATRPIRARSPIRSSIT